MSFKDRSTFNLMFFAVAWQGLVEARNTEDKSFKKDMDRIRIRCPNSENISFGSSVPECVETTWSTDSVGTVTSSIFSAFQ